MGNVRSFSALAASVAFGLCALPSALLAQQPCSRTLDCAQVAVTAAAQAQAAVKVLMDRVGSEEAKLTDLARAVADQQAAIVSLNIRLEDVMRVVSELETRTAHITPP